MLRALLDRLTYANIVATLALFVAIGTGGAYAASKIDGSDIKKHSLTGRQFKSSSIGSRVVKESSLRPVPRAQNAARLGGQPASRYIDSCPQAFAPTVPIADVCVEVQARPPESYREAAFACSLTDNRERAGRRLPTYQELMVALANPQVQRASGGELTSEVYPSSSRPGKLEILSIADNGDAGLIPDDSSKAFRCVASPMN